MEGVLFKWIWTYMPDLESCMLYDMNEVEYLKSPIGFDTRHECISDALVHIPLGTMPYGANGPYLYIMEYDGQYGILQKCTLTFPEDEDI